MVTKSTSATASSERARRATVAALAVACLALTTARPAHAGEPDCPTASEDGQRARDRGKLREARDLFRICSRNACPGIVRKDCSKWLAEIEESVPTIVIAARDAAGTDLTEVKIFVDGVEVASRADGKPLAIDPGEHVLRFEMEGAPAKTEPVVIRTGEKNRLIRVELASAVKRDPQPVPGSQPKPTPTEPDKRSEGGVPVLAYVLGGVGVVAIGSFAFFGLTAKKDLDDLKNTCAPFCAQSDLDSVKSRMLIADVSLGVGIAALGVATYLLVTSGPKEAAKSSGSARGVRVDAGALPGGGGVSFAAPF